jgi:hypothetical protein
VVPTEKVEYTVDNQHRHLRKHVSPLASGLRTGSLHADHDVSQELTMKISALSLPHRERQHVCRRIDLPIHRVKFLDFIVFG